MIERTIPAIEPSRHRRKRPQRRTQRGDLLPVPNLQHRVRRQPRTHPAARNHLIIRAQRQLVHHSHSNGFQAQNLRTRLDSSSTQLGSSQPPQASA
ncbi:hypothetical protein AN948_15085 [Rhodococcus sp. ADH]|nr:hypothetical protein AN948_15085 [Rhodococcus sp. ADH]